METTLIMEILKPVICAILTAVAGIAGIYVKKIGSQIIEWFKAKTTKETYDQALIMAQGLYIYLEDKYGETFKKMGAVKKAEMSEMLLNKFPTLTQEELDSINKLVWISFQEGFDGTYSNKADTKDTTVRVDG